ncbi:putative patatin/cPLA2 family phospholipase [Paenibacillus taihuensis]|uniref:Putative patatin/cPLA2 family phospholipase n=1 Tax=Paenibacillus taihuensis TaxID=1156355 RepID=A0A3D9RXU6_9BACL|nr:patatin family protein [Paenibacillus taihuensis]REE81495.1 putative patatin/cPLA2 family phospholipase [Paenibacillus taihuensis]
MDSIGLILEGGGMRGIYTAGVLDYFAEQNLFFPYTIGVSAGACMGASYLSRQIGRNREVNVNWVTDPRYISWSGLFKKGELFGMDFIFDELPNKLVPFDSDAFNDSPEEFVIGTTDIETGETVYYRKSDPEFDLLTVLRASSSLPFIAPIIEYKGRKLLDGGISDPIPVRQAERDGYKRNVLVLTRNENYRKSKNKFSYFVRRAYRKFPKFVQKMLTRDTTYNGTLDYIAEQESKGNVFVIRPQQKLTVGRLERDSSKLDALYLQGYEEAKQLAPKLKAWLEQEQEQD